MSPHFHKATGEGPHLADLSLSHQDQCSLTVVHRIPKRCTPLPVARLPPDEPTMADAFEMDRNPPAWAAFRD